MSARCIACALGAGRTACGARLNGTVSAPPVVDELSVAQFKEWTDLSTNAATVVKAAKVSTAAGKLDELGGGIQFKKHCMLLLYFVLG